MRITIDYEASWRNSFLDGSNNEAIPKKGRKFVGSMQALNDNKGNYKSHKITLDTALGILNRLIGDQRKLYQSDKGLYGHPHYFKEMMQTIRWIDKPRVLNEEIVYIRNMSGNTDQNSFTGMIKANDPAFQSDFSLQFWGVLYLDFDQLCEFILENKMAAVDEVLHPNNILNRLEELKKKKLIENIDKAKLASEKLTANFKKFKPLKNGKLTLLPMYCSALYLQLKHLEQQYNMNYVKGARGGIQGISHNGYTPKNFLNKYVTGGEKLIYGNAYFLEGEKNIKRALIKASGQLDIYLNIDIEKAIELKNLIDCAGVSSFYLGKKGLAYVSSIDVRDVHQEKI